MFQDAKFMVFLSTLTIEGTLSVKYHNHKNIQKELRIKILK